MNDSEFLQAFEACTLDQFPHRQHIRMAWLYLRAFGWNDGMSKIRDGIQRFAASKGATGKYHETITVFWARLVHHVIIVYPEIQDFDSLVALHPDLLDTRLIAHHYSPALLSSDSARHAWVEPDLLPMPELLES
jgi:hypothetical protein